MAHNKLPVIGATFTVALMCTLVQAVNIGLVTVGNPGNAPDTRYGRNYTGNSSDPLGYGGVGYAFQMGKYEVTTGQYCEFLNAVAKTDTYGLYNTNMDTAVNTYGCNIKRTGSSGSYTYSVASNWANRPVNLVSWGDAARFANWIHNGQPTGVQNASTTEDGSYYLNGATSDTALLTIGRKANATWVIPSEDEWYKAAYHKNDGVTGNYWNYTTSGDSVPSNDLITPDPGSNANFYENDYTISSPYWRTPVGEFENSDSPYGTYDQGGNVFEWNQTVVLVMGTVIPELSPNRGLRGGSFLNSSDILHAAGRDWWLPSYEHVAVGFRVAEVPEPASAVLLLVGSLAAAMRRRLQ